MVNAFCCTVCYTVGRVSVPLWLADLARPVPISDGHLPGLVVDRIVVLRRGQEQDCEGRESEALEHGATF